MNLKQATALVLLAAVWGGSFLFIRIAAPMLGPLPLMGGRVLIAGAILWAVSVALRQRLRLRAHARGLLVLGAVNAAIPFALIGWAELRLNASLASLLNATVPVFTALVSAAWLKHRLTGREASGLLLGIVGVALLVGWSPITLTKPVLLSVAAMLTAALCYGWSAVYTRQRLSGTSPFTLAAGQQLAAGAVLLFPAASQLPAATPTPAALRALVALAVLSTALAYLLYFYLIARVGPTKTNSVTFLIPAFGMGWGALFLGEPITRGMIGGLAVILMSLLLVSGIRLGRGHAGANAATEEGAVRAAAGRGTGPSKDGADRAGRESRATLGSTASRV